VILRRFVDRGHILVYRVAHFVGRRGFDKKPNSTAHGGAVVNDDKSGPGRTGHLSAKLLRFVAKNNSRRDPITPSEETLSTLGQIGLRATK
jgi:hypothetical protein